jgi:DNA-binding CsgD family transcriptional regulator
LRQRDVVERRLTAQERDVLRLHGLGRSSHEIARDLGMGEMTVAWIIANLVAERGARRTEELAQSLAYEPQPNAVTAPSVSFAELAVPLVVMIVLSLVAFAALAATGTLHFAPVPAASPESASPTAFGSATPLDPSSHGAPGDVSRESMGPGTAPGPNAPAIAPTAPPLAPTFMPIVPTALPVVPTLGPVVPTLVPTAVPTLPIPLPPLPTVPPLPTPHLGPLTAP